MTDARPPNARNTEEPAPAGGHGSPDAAEEAGGEDDAADEPESAPYVRQLLIAAAVVALAVIAYFVFDTGSGVASGAAPPRGEPLPVTTLRVAPRDVPIENTFLGETEPSELVEIRARVSGHLVERGFDDGQRVEEGQMLFRIDPATFEAALAEASAGLRSAEAQVARARQQTERLGPLVEKSQAAVDDLEAAQANQSVAQALVATRTALLQRAELELGYATIRAPFDGVIGERTLDVGSYVNGAADVVLATVRQVHPMHVRFSVSETDLVQWQTRTKAGRVSDIPIDEFVVTLVLPGGPVFEHTGTIDYVDVAVDPVTGTAVVRATVPNPEHTLRPGQFVRARVSGAARLEVLVVPRSAVLQAPVGATVFVVDEDGAAQPRPVELGDWTEDGWIIDSGLAPGDRVITDQLMKLRPGMPVAPAGA